MRQILSECLAIADVELRKLIRDPTELVSRAIQPVLWLAIFGQVLGHVRGIDTGRAGYLAFMTPGILAQSVLFSAIFYGIAVIWERDLGIVHKLLVSPASRWSLVCGKALAADFRGLVQAVVIYAIGAVLQVPIRWQALAILEVLLVVALGSAIFATFSLIMACIVKTRERFMGIGQVLTMPLFFASNAIYPLDIMPAWLKVIATLNPLTYLVDALRGLMVHDEQSTYGLGFDCAVLALVLVAFLAIAVRIYPKLVQ
ncbi:MAG TPA: ABC transporter permease [Steroidobacteraceae bacterium]|nr:ABC transporter permease [Steroidobacteraceae bacterium]